MKSVTVGDRALGGYLDQDGSTGSYLRRRSVVSDKWHRWDGLLDIYVGNQRSPLYTTDQIPGWLPGLGIDEQVEARPARFAHVHHRPNRGRRALRGRAGGVGAGPGDLDVPRSIHFLRGGDRATPRVAAAEVAGERLCLDETAARWPRGSHVVADVVAALGALPRTPAGLRPCTPLGTRPQTPYRQ